MNNQNGTVARSPPKQGKHIARKINLNETIYRKEEQ